uniref:Uncharacterized protein n=1 Tax=viral metagenome TaxID=1070528 RepID=A0A6M3XN28_9ZZZZ
MDKIKDYLNEVEHTEVKKFVANKVMFEAVRKVLMESVYLHGTLKEGKPADAMINYTFFLASRKKSPGFTNLTNEQIGADLVAVWEGTNLVEGGFKDLEKFTDTKVSSEGKKNPGR